MKSFPIPEPRSCGRESAHFIRHIDQRDQRRLTSAATAPGHASRRVGDRRSIGWAKLIVALLFLACAGARPARAEAMLQLFNLSWNEVAQKMPELAEAGYTSLWLPPPTKGSGGYSVGYDLWDPFDLGDKDQRGTVATRYGTREELLRMVRIAHRFGLRVYFDNIVNHRAFDVPGYNASTPTNLYPGMVPGDFHLLTIAGGFYRNTANISNFGDDWPVVAASAQAFAQHY